MTPAAARAWVRLPSGRRLDLINPDPGAWLDSDLALRLARTYRWGGESSWPLPLSVAQHSLLVLALRRQWSDTPLPASDALLELLHDAEEGFLGFDCISPLKDVLGLSFRAVSSRLMAAVSERYELRAWSPAAHAVHKRADSVAAASEAVHCIGWPAHEVRDVLGIVHPVLDVDPLAEIYGCRPWEPWAADVAAERFLDALYALQSPVLQSSASEGV
ncbi:phosphohydrolase (plasmid) [Acidovorax carolinensis]|uniref:Phosphohydrolase n=1 Tax=Acidovorax carolinensis TaxID=553814 RepID=A0A240UKJ3_9BURK|nr:MULTISPECIES: phosphohydrolase [Burkholderiales]ART57432.1 phosphohydrolase [Acidovorax carolinensis]ART61562.1 phosphohydrolase [Acidovorax carolinensis]TXH09912.1 MAG: phosphohydrolase [Gammaproteobacteria bacterium]